MANAAIALVTSNTFSLAADGETRQSFVIFLAVVSLVVASRVAVTNRITDMGLSDTPTVQTLELIWFASSTVSFVHLKSKSYGYSVS